ncbi:uncharacterized protein LOC141900806 [Tubulanus polymorphus]|uniref:uncharacterized protein LOC141900806 n=1 Tax=Tubulanus polymorphus TaxID=672921 RepID=UPI003DA20723
MAPEEIAVKGSDPPSIDKISKSRSSLAGWLTRTVDSCRSQVPTLNSKSAILLLKDRLVTAFERLKQKHQQYISVASELDLEIAEAELWFEPYNSAVVNCLDLIDSKIDSIISDFTSVTSVKSVLATGQQTSSVPLDVSSSATVNHGQSAYQDAAIPGDTSSEAIDDWIDKLVIGQETVVDVPTSRSSDSNDEEIFKAFTKLSCDRDLPKVVFDGSALMWPRFVDQFYEQVHSRYGLVDSRRMDLLLSHTKGEARKMIQGLGYSGRNYAQALQELKHVFGHKVLVARACLNSITGPVIQSTPTSIRDFYVSVAKRLPVEKRGKWNEYVRSISSRNREPNLIDLGQWLKDRVDADCGPFAVYIPPKGSQIVSNVNNSPRLSTWHVKANCPSKGNCHVCKRRHHTSIHRDEQRPSGPSSGSGLPHHSQVMSAIVPVIAHGSNGRCIATFALLDSASDVTLVECNLAKDLGLKGQPDLLKMRTLTSTETKPSEVVSFSLSNPVSPDSAKLNLPEVWTRQGTISCPPQSSRISQQYDHFRDLTLSDIHPGDVKILIGGDVPFAHIQLEIRQGERPMDPIAVRTHLGWCILGPAVKGSRNEPRFGFKTTTIETHGTDFLLDKQIEKFWETETFGGADLFDDVKKSRSVEDHRGLEILDKSCCLVDGHYQVGMLWRDMESFMPNNRFQAEIRFKNLKKRLNKDPQLMALYCKTVNGYIEKGHARKVSNEELKSLSKRAWFLPHHGVVNPNKSGKVRVVFDAAALYLGVSLNNQLMTGPDLLNSLFGVLQRFRLGAVAIAADVEGMFHQVKDPETDSNSLLFLWQEDLAADGEPEVYKMTVHIFGAADSPCAANYCLKRSATDTALLFSEAAVQTIIRDFYVDDMLKSVSFPLQAIELAEEVTKILARGGFHLTKWMGNNREVLAQISKDERARPELDLDLDEMPVERALGVKWVVESDSFLFRPAVRGGIPTKRLVVSTVSSIFDPCGFVAPYTFRAKFLIQEIWRQNFDWDTALHGDVLTRWQEMDNTKVELHVFCDASEAGFAAVAYLRMKRPSGEFVCSFLASKTKVAPLKMLTVPKLELEGAVLAVMLSSSLKHELKICPSILIMVQATAACSLDSTCGIDYFRPVFVKLGRSTVKRWCCLFTCLVTRAIHLEVADNLETDAFILVLRNFIGRRGPPSEIYSDSGTNFVGADRELREALERLNQVQVHNCLLKRGIVWHFSPPSAPHFGGAWERLVKSSKRVLKQILKGQLVIDSVLRTALIETESVINSRPLTYNSTDPNDFTAITPNHFLHGGPKTINAPDIFEPKEICRRKRGKWEFARVVNVCAGPDGRIRVVKVKTQSGSVLTRPVSKVAVLEESISHRDFQSVDDAMSLYNALKRINQLHYKGTSVAWTMFS